jgi:hypothetical protein
VRLHGVDERNFCKNLMVKKKRRRRRTDDAARVKCFKGAKPVLDAKRGRIGVKVDRLKRGFC